MSLRSGFIVALMLLASRLSAEAQVPAFPGAEGFGAQALGGRGGDVYVVTNLNSSGPGSFFQGLTTIPASGRTIVFAVSGSIRLAGGVATRITGSKLTVAGQTAPGDGILLRDGTLRISGDDIVIRHLRFRHGKNGNGGDCINLDSGCQNAILDHLSMSFSTDENMSSFSSPPDNLTMQWSLNAWGLQSHSCGGLWDQNKATCHHSIWAHNHTRNPKARPNTLLEWTNNITFDWRIGFIMGDSNTPAAWRANVRGNYFICPPGNIRTFALEKGWLDRNAVRRPNFGVHVSGNLIDRNGDGVLNGTDTGYAIVQGAEFDAQEIVPSLETQAEFPRHYRSATPYPGSALLNVEPALPAYKKTLSNAGALRLDATHAAGLRDEVDTRLISNVATQTANHITRESDLTGVSGNGFGTFTQTTGPIDSDRDGMPDNYEAALGWNPSVQDHNAVVGGATYFPSGSPTSYTRLEEYLHFKSVPHLLIARSSVSGSLDLARYTAGFASSPVFTIANVSGGNLVQSGNGGRFVQFTAQTATGRGGFDFTVTDAEGSSWTQRFAVCVVNSLEPSDLVWRGGVTTAADWDTASLHWLKSGTVTTFSGGDRVSFDTGTATSTTVNLPGVVLAAAVDVSGSGSFIFSGTGSLSATSRLSKRGTGTLTIANSGTNSFSGVSLEQGSLAVNAANAVGSATIECLGGSLSLGPAANAFIPAGLQLAAATTITPTTQHTLGGNWSGVNQTVSLSGGAVLWTIGGSWSGFSGRLSFGNGSTRVRLNGNSNVNFGSPAVAVDLGSNNAQIMNRNGATIEFGSLEATGASTVLSGTQTGTTATLYSIGALNRDATFAGTIANGGGVTSITKVGSGDWTLAGASTHSGTTTVSAGTLRVNGSLSASPVLVNSGATLAGSGSLGALVTANSGSKLSPGAGAASAGTMTASAGLALSGATSLSFDLSNSATGTNDRINVTGGTLNVSGASLSFELRPVGGQLGLGTYTLIGGTAVMTASPAPTLHLSGLPPATRQTFSLVRASHGAAPAFIQLVVAGQPSAALQWNGSGGPVWDLATTSNFSGGPTATFFNLDGVTFDDSAPGGTVTLGELLQPRQVVVTASSRAYIFSGTGMIGGLATLTKSGTATLTLAPTILNLTSTNAANSTAVAVAAAEAAQLKVGMAVVGANVPAGTVIEAIDLATGVVTLSQPIAVAQTVALSYRARNSFSGGTMLAGGTIVLTNEAANAYGLGGGPVTFMGGTLTLAGVTGSNGTDTGTFPNDVIVPLGETGTLNVMQRGRTTGDVSGGGTLNVIVRFIRGDHFGDWSGFTGQLNISAAQTGSEFRMAESYSPSGFPNAAVHLGSNVTLKHVGILSSGVGTTIELGELSGLSGSTLAGGVTGGRALTYRIGGRGTDATFAGSIVEQTPGSTLTNIVKIGTGFWTLSGNSAWAGGTHVAQGTLAIGGAVVSAGAVQVSGGASLRLSGGTVTTDTVTLADGAALQGQGTIDGDLNVAGAATVSSVAGGTLTITGDVVNNGTMRIANGTNLVTRGRLVNNGVLDLLTAAPGLLTDFENQGLVIDSSTLRATSAVRSGSTVIVTVLGHGGHTYQLQRATSLTAADWTNVSGAVGAGVTQPNGQPTALQLQDTAATGSQRFYRVMVTP